VSDFLSAESSDGPLRALNVCDPPPNKINTNIFKEPYTCGENNEYKMESAEGLAYYIDIICMLYRYDAYYIHIIWI